jgi:hypothetical protein
MDRSWHFDNPLNVGILLDKAMELIHPPPWSEDQMMDYFTATMQDALSHGLTSLHDAGLSPLAVNFFQKLVCKLVI